jgi:phage terminase large subunit
VAVSTPQGKKGWFYHAWTDPRQDWYRVRKTADDCPRIDRKVIEEDRISRGELFVRQDYYCSFEVLEGLVYPDLPGCAVDVPAGGLPEGRFFAGVDWGFHAPACVLVGLRTADDVLWIIDETYKAGLTNEDLTRRACAVADRYRIEMFYCDPAEPGSIEMFRRNNLPAREGMNRILPGVQAVTARINTGRLKVLRSCVNLLAEAGLYRYPNESERRIIGENPVDENNHAMAALRYMVCGIDRVRELNARAPQVFPPEPPPPADPNVDYRVPIERQPQKSLRIKSAEERFDESEEARRLNREHLESTFDDFRSFDGASGL